MHLYQIVPTALIYQLSICTFLMLVLCDTASVSQRIALVSQRTASVSYRIASVSQRIALVSQCTSSVS
jgi:hypothetical protein